MSSMPLSGCFSHSYFYLLFPLLLLLFYYFLFSHPLLLCLVFPFLFFFLVCSYLCAARPYPSSAHVDMSNVSFDVDPLDLDAEEPPESQGDPRSTKGTSGSVTSPQANAHRLPFFKKVTLGAHELAYLASLPPAFVPYSSKMCSGLISSSPLTNRSRLNCPCRYCSS